VELIVRELSVSYSQVRRSFIKQKQDIDNALDNGDLTESVRLLGKVYNLPNGFVQRVGYSAKIKSPAILQSDFDAVGQRFLRCTVYFRDSRAELLNIPRYRLLHMAAHELAHARMQKDMHPLRTSEFATDVLAVLVMGSSNGYLTHMIDERMRLGYIRHDLLDEVFRCLGQYAESMYLPEKSP
jgi:hypothetical protein